MSLQAMELQIIRTDARISNANFSHGAALTPSEAERAILHRNMLLDYVDELTTQRDDARRIAIDSGVFQDHRGEDYELDGDARDESWRADPVGPVAWEKPIEQT